LQDLRAGSFDVLVGVNLLREGLDLPEVALVAIMDADKEGFLRSARSLTQTAGRAARNVDSLVIMYADKITKSMQQTIDETNRRREKQIAYNIKNNITPTQIIKSLDSSLAKAKQAVNYYVESPELGIAADPVVQYMTKDQLRKTIQNTRKQMEAAVKELDFMEAARLRDEIIELEKRL
jgi:excinuclease ABC subunit B